MKQLHQDKKYQIYVQDWPEMSLSLIYSPILPLSLQLCNCLASTGSFRIMRLMDHLKTVEGRETRLQTPSWRPQIIVSQ